MCVRRGRRVDVQRRLASSIHCNTLQHTATHCSTLQHTAKHCNTLQHTATHCVRQGRRVQVQCRLSPRDNIRAHCIILQQVATHCNTLQHARAMWKGLVIFAGHNKGYERKISRVDSGIQTFKFSPKITHACDSVGVTLFIFTLQ